MTPGAHQYPLQERVLYGHRVTDAVKVMLLCLRHGLRYAAELEAHAGTRWARGAKHGFSHPMMVPQAVILDPEITLTSG